MLLLYRHTHTKSALRQQTCCVLVCMYFSLSLLEDCYNINRKFFHDKFHEEMAVEKRFVHLILRISSDLFIYLFVNACQGACLQKIKTFFFLDVFFLVLMKQQTHSFW